MSAPATTARAPRTADGSTSTREADPVSRRDADIVERAEKGEDLAALGLDFGISRERVRQIVADGSTMSNEEIREARRVYRASRRTSRDEARHVRVRQMAQEHPQATIQELSVLARVNVSTVKAALDWTERERRADQQKYPCVSDEVVLDEIRRVAALPGGSPLTGTFYDEHRTDGVSHARLLQRFGTWTGACSAAGVTPRAANPGRTYTRRWSDAEMLAWVWRYLDATEAPSYARFDTWLRGQQGAPSAQTVRNTLGSWVEMKRLAIEAHTSSN